MLLMAIYEGAKKAGGTLGVVIRGCYLVIVVTEIHRAYVTLCTVYELYVAMDGRYMSRKD